MTVRTKILAGVWMPAFLVRWFAARRCSGERNWQALSAFASHDMRSPMATVRDAASLLIEGVHGKLNDKQHRLLIVILERTETWLRLVDEVIVLPQWVVEGSLLHFREESLRDAMYESIEKTKGLALFREVTVRATIPDTLPKIMVDRLRLVQALTLLLATVISFTKRGDQVGLSATLLSETEVQVKIFGEVALERVEGRAGMSSVRAIVEAHGGRFCVPEAENDPCTFSLPFLLNTISKEPAHVESAHY